MSACTLTRTERLRSLKTIRRLFEQGRSGFVYPFRYIWLSEQSAENTVEVLFSVPKKFLHRANKRNLVRRRTKESYRLSKGTVAEAAADRRISLALIYSTKKINDYKTVKYAVEKILDEVRCSL